MGNRRVFTYPYKIGLEDLKPSEISDRLNYNHKNKPTKSTASAPDVLHENVIIFGFGFAPLKTSPARKE